MDTVIKPLTVDIPYPSIKNVTENRRAAFIVSPAYAGCKGELNAILSYAYQTLIFNSLEIKDTAETLKAISVAEMNHLEIIGELLLKLGANPIYTKRAFDDYNFYDASSVSQSNVPEKMLLDAISSEISTINFYTEIEKKLPEPVGAVIARIRLDEELHVKALKSIMERFSQHAVL